MPSTREAQRPSTPLSISREDSVDPSDCKSDISPSKMFTIQSMLNPPALNASQALREPELDNRSATPTSATSALTASSTARYATLGTPSSASGNKSTKETAALNRSSPTGQVNYPPHEFSSDNISFSSDHQQKELIHQHTLFDIKPSVCDGEGKIWKSTRFIPYASDKKNFFNKTSKEGFSVFEYTFQIPNDGAQTIYTVMWDYDNGLTRITPFFKACNHSKTTPAKALTTNRGLKDLAHSVTGGSLAAQGYWVPYACARAICLTFCYNIRWALTPIFGPSFVKECLPPTHANYQRFKIDPETVHCAKVEAQSWMQAAMHANSPAEIPRSVPQSIAVAGGKELRPRDIPSMFKSGSPFESDGETADRSVYDGTPRSTAGNPSISPKTSTWEMANGPRWTSVNGSRPVEASPVSYTPAKPLRQALLNQPHNYSWRPADRVEAAAPAMSARKASLRTHQKTRTRKRPRSTPKQETPEDEYNNDSSDATSSSSESDDVDIVISPKKRVRLQHTKHGKDTSAATSPRTNTAEQTKSVKFTAEDYRAARLLLALNEDDDHLAMGQNGPFRPAR